MKQIEIGGVKVDYSEACGGVWLDNYELMKFDEVHESAGEELAALTAAPGKIPYDPSARLNCPKDPDFVMARRFHSARAEVEIDECPLCGGIWLDAGELKRIRELFPTEEDMRKANDDFATAVFEESGFADLQKESSQGREKTQRVANFLRWICPSNYF